ncbi:MAG: helicase, partial [Abditibacteriota bacterium]|nr:helicase [Abditibacteriota bacterium]
LGEARKKYGDDVAKEDIFYYVYGFLHSPEYRSKFAADLKLMLPRLPLVDSADDFWAFSKAGRKLAELHLNYEHQPAPEGVKAEYRTANPSYRVEKMKLAKDETEVVYNGDITVTNIPPEAAEYVVNGRSPLGWIVDRYQIRVHKDSGIVNDPNDWCDEHGDPKYILNLLLSVITVSVETMKIVKSLPNVDFG